MPTEVICHNNFAPHNLAFNDGAAWALSPLTCAPLVRCFGTSPTWLPAPSRSPRQPQTTPSRMNDARSRAALILRAYGSDATWDDVLRLASIRLHDLAQASIAKAEGRDKPQPLTRAEGYERDVQYLRSLSVGA